MLPRVVVGVLQLEMCERGDRKACIYKAQEELGIQLKDKQLDAVYRFCCGNDVLVSWIWQVDYISHTATRVR